jgi:DHA1 family bicyclomycin/chloramphenicol resistance-like MFS transporter
MAVQAQASWRLLAALGALASFGPLAVDMYLPGLPAMAQDLDAPDWQAQATVSLCLVGLGVGQFFAGPISDALGRRRPLLAGVLAFTVLSVLCAVAPSMEVLLILRLLQGVAGATSIVVSRAVVRDTSSDADAAARGYTVLVAVVAVAPVLAPLIGGQVLRVTDWRGVFAALAGVGGALLFVAWRTVPESLGPELRHRGGLVTARRWVVTLLRDRTFAGTLVAGSLAFTVMFTYIGTSPFVLQEDYGLSAGEYSAVFAANALGMVAGSQATRRLLRRFSSSELLAAGVSLQTLAALGLVAVAVTDSGLWPLLVCQFVTVASVGLILPNATALAMNRVPEAAGTASGLFGLTQFSFGATGAPLATAAGGTTATTMAVTMAALALAALLVLRVTPGAWPRHAPR